MIDWIQNIVRYASIAAIKGIACLIPLLLLGGMAQDGPTRANQVKATFLYNFTKFIEWPSGSFADAQAPFVIGILGDDPFGRFIDQTVSGEAVKGHPIVIHRYKTFAEIERCHVLFVSPAAAPEFKINRAGLQPNVLTVGDSPDFNQDGGMIRLTTKENKIKLVINPAAVKAADLTMSSKLLSVAEIFSEPS